MIERCDVSAKLCDGQIRSYFEISNIHRGDLQNLELLLTSYGLVPNVLCIKVILFTMVNEIYHLKILRYHIFDT